MVQLLGFLLFALSHAAFATGTNCESQVQVGAERAIQDLPASNMKRGLEAFTGMHLTGVGVTVIAAEKKGRNAKDEDTEELSKRVETFLDTASPFFLGVGDTGQDLKIPRASSLGKLLREPDFLRKFMEELGSPDFDGTGNMAMSIKVKASFVRNYLLSEEKIKDHEAIPIFIDTTLDTVMRQGFYAVMNERGMVFPKMLVNLEKLAQDWRAQVPVHFVIRANLVVIQPFHHNTEVAIDFAPEGSFDPFAGHHPLRKTHYDQVRIYGAGQSLYILAIPQPLKPLEKRILSIFHD